MPAGWNGAHGLGAMKQLTLATAGFERYGKTTRRAALSGRDGARGAVAGAVRFDPAGPSEGGPGPAAHRGGADAAPLLPPAVVGLADPAVEEALYE